jgi:LPXTG-motif cell wall-anchored protein
VAGIVLQARFGWDVLTTFLITLGLCALAVGIVALLFGRRKR